MDSCYFCHSKKIERPEGAIPADTFVASDGNEIVSVTQDAAQLGGSQTYKGNGAWVVYGSGTDIWGTSDQFRYVYRAQAGDATLATHVDFQANTSIYVKAGLMVRASNAANAPYYDVVVDAPNAVIAVQYRDTAANQVVIAGVSPPTLPPTTRRAT